MKKLILFTFILFTSCNNNVETNIFQQEILVKQEYRVKGSTSSMLIYIFEIEGHEYIGDVYSDYFIHSPNCKCK